MAFIKRKAKGRLRGRRRKVRPHRRARPNKIVHLGGGNENFPSRLSTTLKMMTDLDISCTLGGTAGNAAGYLFRANCATNLGPSINYPLGTAGGSMVNIPSGLYYLLSQNLASGASHAPYSYYQVVSSKIQIEWTTQGLVTAAGSANAANLSAIQVVLLPVAINGVGSAPTINSTALMEYPMAKGLVIPQILEGAPKVMTHSCSTKKALGLGRLHTQDEQFSGTATTEPARQWTWMIQVNNIDGSTSNINLNGRVTIWQKVIFYDRNYQTSSSALGAGPVGGLGGLYHFYGTGATGGSAPQMSAFGDVDPTFVGNPTLTFTPYT